MRTIDRTRTSEVRPAQCIRRWLPTLFLSAFIPFWLACAQPSQPAQEATAEPAPAAPASLPAAASPAPAAPPLASTNPVAAQGPLVLFVGDSLTAGQGVDAEEAFPALLGAELEHERKPVRVVNAGVSGDTTAGGLARLDWLLRQKPDVVVVELGANDGLRGLSLPEMEKNLRQIVVRCQDSGAKVLLVGMRIPPNYGPDYSREFAAIYPRLAQERKAAFLPFLLEGVGGIASLNQADGIHPTAEGHRKVAATVLPYLLKVIDSAAPAAVP